MNLAGTQRFRRFQARSEGWTKTLVFGHAHESLTVALGSPRPAQNTTSGPGPGLSVQFFPFRGVTPDAMPGRRWKSWCRSNASLTALSEKRNAVFDPLSGLRRGRPSKPAVRPAVLSPRPRPLNPPGRPPGLLRAIVRPHGHGRARPNPRSSRPPTSARSTPGGDEPGLPGTPRHLSCNGRLPRLPRCRNATPGVFAKHPSGSFAPSCEPLGQSAIRDLGFLHGVPRFRNRAPKPGTTSVEPGSSGGDPGGGLKPPYPPVHPLDDEVPPGATPGAD